MQWHVFEETDAAIGSNTLQLSSLYQVPQRGRTAPVLKFCTKQTILASQRKKDKGRKRKQLSYFLTSTWVCLPEKLQGCTSCSHHSVFSSQTIQSRPLIRKKQSIPPKVLTQRLISMREVSWDFLSKCFSQLSWLFTFSWTAVQQSASLNIFLMIENN